jgi:nucleoside-diphosphate-sugar epimerase
MKHLVLGSEGQIGGHLVKFLKGIGEDVIEFDILRNDYEDLRIPNNKILNEKMKESDIVHFLAFDIGGSIYMKRYQNTYDFIADNMKIICNVFEALYKYSTPFIFASSQMSNMAHSTYGKLKSIGEIYTRVLNGITVKFWNVYGHERDPEKSHVITDFIKMARDKGKIMMKTDGQEYRQFLFGDDCAECLYILSEKYDKVDRDTPLHITSFKWTKIIDIAKIISKIFNKCSVIPNIEKDSIQKNIKNEPDKYILKFWKPKTSLEEGINRVIEMMP